MKLNKSVIEGVLLLTLAITLTVTAVVSDSTLVRGGATGVEYTFNTDSESNGLAGISEMLLSKLDSRDEVSNTVSVENNELALVTSGIDSASATTVTRADLVLTKEQVDWLDYLFADVADKLNVRESGSMDAPIVGRIGVNARAEILERGDEWTKIRSGNVEGYVNNLYCIFGVDALAYAQATLDQYAVATVDVNIRANADETSTILDTLASGKSIKVSKETVSVDGWVPVIVGSTVGYIRSDYVTVDYKVETALTIAEEAEIEKQRKLEEMKKKQVAPPSKVYGASIEATDEEIHVMAALLMCEAGGSYEGMLAVGAVICNRVKSSGWQSSLYAVMYAPNQFSPVWSGKLDRQLSRGVSETAVKAAKAALAGEDPTSGCHSFRATWTGHPGYVIGANVFF